MPNTTINISFRKTRVKGGWKGTFRDASGRLVEFTHADEHVMMTSVARHLKMQAAALVKQAVKIEKAVGKGFFHPSEIKVREASDAGKE